MSRLPAVTREAGATAVFLAAWLFGCAIAPNDPAAIAATSLFYLVLLANTYFSIRFFRSLPPEDRDERVIDGLLVLAYLALAASIGRVMLFLSVSTVLFVLAVAKYALLRRIMPGHFMPRRKIFINSLGVALCTGSLVIALAGYPLAGAWTEAIIFALANVYLLLIRPMYAA